MLRDKFKYVCKFSVLLGGMSTTSKVPDAALTEIRRAIRAGDFFAVLNSDRLMDVLQKAVEASTVDDVACLQASVMASEMLDQTSQYAAAERYLAFDLRGCRALKRLEELSAAELLRLRQPGTAPQQPTRRLLRALAFFCLQHAIAMHRDTKDASLSLKRAVSLAQEAEQYLQRMVPAGYYFAGALSMFQYWLGRFELLSRNWDGARTCFQTSMRYEHDNLRYHLERHADGKHANRSDASDPCEICAERIRYTNYLLASNMAFGLAVVEMEEGTVENALSLLRPAMIMLDGSRDDFRKGYVRLLTGRAERVRAGARSAELERALQLLQEAERFFARDRLGNAGHALYSARALHQLCLAAMFKARDRKLPAEDREDALCQAARHFLGAMAHFSKNEGDRWEQKSYIDRRLEVRLALTKTRLLGQILKHCGVEGMAQERLESWSHRVNRPLALLSATWARCCEDGVRARDDAAILGQLAAELLRGMADARAADSDLSGKGAGRSYMQLAEGEAVAAAVQYGGNKVSAEAVGRISTLQRPRKKAASGVLPSGRTPTSWQHLLLDEQILKLRTLLKTQRTFKVRAAAEVTLAHLLFLRGGSFIAAARNQLQEKWEPFKGLVENHILHDAVAEMLAAFERTNLVAVVPLERPGGPLRWKDILIATRKEILLSLRAAGLDDAAICGRLKITPTTIGDWTNAQPSTPPPPA